MYRSIYISNVQSIKSKVFLKSSSRFKNVSINPRDLAMAVLCRLEMKQELWWSLNDKRLFISDNHLKV